MLNPYSEFLYSTGFGANMLLLKRIKKIARRTNIPEATINIIFFLPVPLILIIIRLFVVLFILDNCKCPVNLLKENNTGHLMWKCHF